MVNNLYSRSYVLQIMPFPSPFCPQTGERHSSILRKCGVCGEERDITIVIDTPPQSAARTMVAEPQFTANIEREAVNQRLKGIGSRPHAGANAISTRTIPAFRTTTGPYSFTIVVILERYCLEIENSKTGFSTEKTIERRFIGIILISYDVIK